MAALGHAAATHRTQQPAAVLAAAPSEREPEQEPGGDELGRLLVTLRLGEYAEALHRFGAERSAHNRRPPLPVLARAGLCWSMQPVLLSCIDLVFCRVSDLGLLTADDLLGRTAADGGGGLGFKPLHARRLLHYLEQTAAAGPSAGMAMSSGAASGHGEVEALEKEEGEDGSLASDSHSSAKWESEDVEARNRSRHRLNRSERHWQRAAEEEAAPPERRSKSAPAVCSSNIPCGAVSSK